MKRIRKNSGHSTRRLSVEALEPRTLLSVNFTERNSVVNLNIVDNGPNTVQIAPLGGGRIDFIVDGTHHQTRAAVSQATVRTYGGNDRVTATDAVLAKLILYGGTGNDVLTGGGAADVLYGEDGNDILDGGAGNDAIYGHNGNDVLYGRAGRDVMYGGNGNDVLYGGWNPGQQPDFDYMDGGCYYADTYYVTPGDTAKMDNQYPRIRDTFYYYDPSGNTVVHLSQADEQWSGDSSGHTWLIRADAVSIQRPTSPIVDPLGRVQWEPVFTTNGVTQRKGTHLLNSDIRVETTSLSAITIDPVLRQEILNAGYTINVVIIPG